MTHRHVFKLITDESGCPVCHYAVIVAIAKCECGEQIGPTEIERRLNATGCLGEFEARIASRACATGMPLDNTAQFPRVAECLEAYALALEESDG